MKDILECWPFPFKPRPNQVVALKWLQEQKARYLLLESPVGSGKSAIGICYSHYLAENFGDRYDYEGEPTGNSFILTPQRMLQAQYEESVAGIDEIDMASLYGRSNYDCFPHSTTCDVGDILKPKCENCPCDIAREYAKTASEAVMNYALALNSFAYTKGFAPRQLMILDECHTVEEHLVNFGALAILRGRCEKYKLPFVIKPDMESAYEWITDEYQPALQDVLLKLKNDYDVLADKAKLTTKEKRKVQEYKNVAKHVGKVKGITKMGLNELEKEFVYTVDKINKSNFEFKRLYGRVPFRGILDPIADRFLFMSSTILDKDGFCDDLGFEPEDTAFLSLQSEFKIKNRKVLYTPQMKMNAKWQDPKFEYGRNNLMKTIEAICSMNKEHKGIIHTANFQIAKWLVENLDIDQKIYHHNPGCQMDRNTVINNFMVDPAPAVLISPSSTEGLDLKDDLGRFAIFAKIPFGYLGDDWIKTRMQLSGEWYKRRALIDVIQGGGRVVRTETDWGVVFILDSSWEYLFRTTHRMVPQWWKAAYFDK